MSAVPSDIEIARAAQLRPIDEIAERLGIPAEALHPYGRHIAKVDHRLLGEPQAAAATASWSWSRRSTRRRPARARPRPRSASATR